MSTAPSPAVEASHGPSGLLPPVLGEPCRCGTRDEEHEPVLLLPLPVSVTAMSRLATALDKVLAESGRHGVLLTDGQHPNGVVYAVARAYLGDPS